MRQRSLKARVSTSACKMYIYPVHLDASRYLPEEGYPIETKAKYENRLLALFSQAAPLVFDVLNNLFVTFLTTMHHSHSRPTNYSQVLMQTRIQQQERRQQYYRSGVIRPRRGKIYYPRGPVRAGHLDELKGSRANVWLVTFQSPQEVERNGGRFDKDQAMICFSETDAIQLNKNAHLLAKRRGAEVFFDLTFNKDRYDALYATHPVDDVYNRKLKKLTELKAEISSEIKLETDSTLIKKSMLKRAWEYLIPKHVRAWNNLDFQFNLRRYVLVEASNPKRDTVFFKKAVAYQKLNAELYQRYEHNKEAAPFINEFKIKLDDSLAILRNKANAYLLSHLDKYVADKFKRIDAEGMDANIPTLTLLKMKGAVLRDLRKIDYNKVYRELPKKSGLFDVNFSHFNEIIDHQLARSDVPAYIDDIRMTHHK